MSEQNTIIVNGVPVNIDGTALFALLSSRQRTNKKMSEYALSWYENFKKKQIRPRTQVTYESLLHKHILPFFGDMNVQDIDVSDIQKFYDERKDFAKSTIHQCSVLLHQIFKAAIEDRLIDYNPTESMRLTYSNRAKTREALTQDEIKDIIRQLPRLKRNDLLMLALMIFTGERRGEVLGLRWEDIDFENHLVYVKRAVGFISNKPIVGPTKSKAGIREIPLLPELEEILTKYRMETGYIVGGKDEPLSERAYRRAYERICKSVELHGATAHVFRHTFLTMAIDSLDLKTLQSLAGHASHVTTMRYVHKRDEKIREAGEKLTGMYA